MPQVTSPEQLFVHELKDMYYAEKALTQTLPQLAREASDRELERAFRTHLEETEKHVANLERVFEHLGKRPEAHPCPGIEGIKKEHDEFMRENEPTAKLKDVFLTGAAARAEHYEIAAYNGLVSQARALGERDQMALVAVVSVQLIDRLFRRELRRPSIPPRRLWKVIEERRQ